VKCSGLDNLVLAGDYVAFGSNGPIDHYGDFNLGVVVIDLRNGRTVHSVPTGTPTPQQEINAGHAAGSSGVGPTTAIVLKSDGSVAWIVRNVYDMPMELEVHKADRAGTSVLASSADLDPGSLALAGATLYWIQGGKPFAATFK